MEKKPKKPDAKPVEDYGGQKQELAKREDAKHKAKDGPKLPPGPPPRIGPVMD